MRLRSLLWIPLALAVTSITATAGPVTVSYQVGAHNVSVSPFPDGSFAAAVAAGFPDGGDSFMVGNLTFTLPTFDYAWWDPLHGIYVAPFAELQMSFFDDASPQEPFLSVDVVGPLVATIDLGPNSPFGSYAYWSFSIFGANGLTADFASYEPLWPNDSADNLLRVGRGEHPEFSFGTPDYSVYGPGHIDLVSVPEPRISSLLYGLCFFAVAAGRVRRRTHLS